jgi:phage antirepressor YoqD-like protein
MLTGTAAAKLLQVRPKDLFAHMRTRGWLYRRPGAARWLGYQRVCNKGWLAHKVITVECSDGTDKVFEQVYVTPSGLARLASEMGVETVVGTTH